MLRLDFHQNGFAIFLEGLCCDVLAVALLVLTCKVDGRLTAAAYDGTGWQLTKLAGLTKLCCVG